MKFNEITMAIFELIRGMRTTPVPRPQRKPTTGRAPSRPLDAPDLWAKWPDDYMCPISEVSEHNHRSDDYEVVDVKAYDETATPSAWVRVKR